MTQPLDRTHRIPAKGAIDHEAGEFWRENPFEMLWSGDNLSAYERNRFFLNRPDGPFVDLSFESGADLDSDSRTAIVADFDRDNAPDLLVGNVGGGPLRLLRNTIPSGARRMRIRLKGTKGNRRGIGARVTVECQGRRIVRDVFPSVGFSGQNPPELLIGLGDAERVDRLSIRWPSGTEDVYQGLPHAATIEATEGAGEVEVVP